MKVHVCGILDRYLKSSNLFETILRGISITSRLIATSKHEALPKSGRFLPFFFCLKLVSGESSCARPTLDVLLRHHLLKQDRMRLVKSGCPVHMDSRSKYKCGFWSKIAIYSDDWTFQFISQNVDLHPSNASVVTQNCPFFWPRSKAKRVAVTS